MPRVKKSRKYKGKQSNRSQSVKSRSISKAAQSRENRAHKRSILRDDPILRNANNPAYTSCKYFAANEYFKSLGYSGKTLYNKVEHMIDGTDGLSENNKLPIFEPKGAGVPGGLTLFFITYLPGVPGIANIVGYQKTPIIHGFLVNNTPRGYFIYSSWGCSRAASQEEYNEYSTTMYGIGETPVNIDNFEIDKIKRKPTRQGPFNEDDLREGLINVKENLQMLFGLTDEENAMEEKSTELDHIQIQMYKEE
jgi:hypothetical protein